MMLNDRQNLEHIDSDGVAYYMTSDYIESIAPRSQGGSWLISDSVKKQFGGYNPYDYREHPEYGDVTGTSQIEQDVRGMVPMDSDTVGLSLLPPNPERGIKKRVLLTNNPMLQDYVAQKGVQSKNLSETLEDLEESGSITKKQRETGVKKGMSGWNKYFKKYHPRDVPVLKEAQKQEKARDKNRQQVRFGPSKWDKAWTGMQKAGRGVKNFFSGIGKSISDRWNRAKTNAQQRQRDEIGERTFQEAESLRAKMDEELHGLGLQSNHEMQEAIVDHEFGKDNPSGPGGFIAMVSGEGNTLDEDWEDRHGQREVVDNVPRTREEFYQKMLTQHKQMVKQKELEEEDPKKERRGSRDIS